jgi:hypothetical protein
LVIRPRGDRSLAVTTSARDAAPAVAPASGSAPGSDTATFLRNLKVATAAVASLVRSACPESASGDQAEAAVALFSEIERLGASGVALFTPIVIKTGSYTKKGDGSAPAWLAKLAGTSPGAAKGRLAAAERAAAEPCLTEALHEGDLSIEQLRATKSWPTPSPVSERPAAVVSQNGSATTG